MSIRLVIADDHTMFLAGLERLLRDEKDFEVLAAVTRTSQAIRAIREKRPDVAVLDVQIPEETGLGVVRAIRSEKLPTRVVLLTASLGAREAVESVELGVEGVILKDMAAHQLVQCIRKVHAGGKWIETGSTQRALAAILDRSQTERKLAAALTAREFEVFRVAATGVPNREIAQRLFISEGTVKMHLHAIYEKLGLSGRVELMAHAQKLGISGD
ncbi:MAG TPA: response regulator transcription factor [Thermoanaerobaculia bacterium]|nr:response regulator transcription factor [Thermoanaerobaculia bacterium]